MKATSVKNSIKNSIKNSVKIITLTLAVFLSAFTIPHQTVHADGREIKENAESHGGGSAATGTGAGGANHQKTGLVVYLVDKEKGYLLDEHKLMVLVNSGTGADAAHTGIYGKAPFKEEFAVHVGGSWEPNDTRIVVMDDMPDLVYHDLTGKIGIEGWLKGKPAAGSYDTVYHAIAHHPYFTTPDGKSIVDEHLKKGRSVSVIFEPWAVHYWFRNGGGDSGISPWRFNTVCGWAAKDCEGGGSYGLFTSKLDDNSLAHILQLKEIQFGWKFDKLQSGAKKTSGNISNSDLKEEAYGIGIFNLDTAPGQTTCDEGQGGSPSAPPDESNGNMKIVKTYATMDVMTREILSEDGCYRKTDSASEITIEDESVYKLAGWKVTDTYTSSDVKAENWSSNVPGKASQSGNKPDKVTLSNNDKVVYLLLLKPQYVETVVGEFQYILSQSSITRKIKLSVPDKNAGYTNISTIPANWSSSGHKTSCPGCHSCGGCVPKSHGPGHTCPGNHSCHGWTWKDQSLNFSLKNVLKDNYPDIVATKSGNENVTKTGASELGKRYVYKTRTNTGDDTVSIDGWDEGLVLMRGKDKLTLAKWKNENLGCAGANTYLSGLSSSGFAVSDSDSGTRRTADYLEEFGVRLENDSPDLTTVYGPTESAKGGGRCSDSSKTYGLNSPLEASVKVKVETYSGRSSGTTKVNTDIADGSNSFSFFVSVNPTGGLVLKDFPKTMGTEVKSGASVKFHPYIQMNYDMYTNRAVPYGTGNSETKKAYVLGEHDREIEPNDYAEISWKEKDKPNLDLQSLQWSTHASVWQYVSKELGTDPNELRALPGGAVLSLIIREGDRQKVSVTTYQTVVEGTGKEQIERAGGTTGGLSVESAKGFHRQYVETVKNSIDKLNVEEWITTTVNPDKNVWQLSNSGAIDAGEGLSHAGHPNQTASTEWKYYFSGEGERPEAPMSEGDLDVKETGFKDEIYTFYVNTYGELYMLYNDPDGNKGNERAGTRLDPNSLSGAALHINRRTHVIDKLMDAVERGTGIDNSGRPKTGARWYNEGFDGISVYIQNTVLTVGYVKPMERSTVLDPKQTQTSTGQRDMFNKKKYNMAQFRTRGYSDAYKGQEWKAGVFKGSDVYMKDMGMLFYSKPFLIPNMTVQDLH